MIETRSNTNTTSDEINLLEILVQLINTFKNYFRVFVISIIAGLIIGIIFYYREAPFYKTRMIADSGTLPNTEIINIVESWQSLLDKGDYAALSGILNLSETSTRKIKKLEAEDTGTLKTTQSTTTKNENSFLIRAEVTDYKILDSLERSIIFNLENNEFVKRRVALKQENYALLKKKISLEIASLDSIKSAYRRLLESRGNSTSAFLTDPANVNIRIVELYEKILNLDTQIKLRDDIQVIEGFSKSSRPDGPKLIPFLIVGLSIGLITAFLLIIVKFLNKKIRGASNAYTF